MAKIKPINLQDIVTSLEEYKRYLGRRYDHTVHPSVKTNTFIKYNAVEQQIEYLVHEHGCERYSKPYTLKDKLDMMDGKCENEPGGYL